MVYCYENSKKVEEGVIFMKRILVISWFYPPINSSEGLVTYKLLKYSKLQYDICMQESNASWSYGKNELLPETANVHKIPLQADSLDVWKQKSIEYFENHKDEYDIVMTRSMPPESHMIGLKIKEIKPEIIWIASFGDPIANNPFVLKTTKKISPYSLKNRYIRTMSIREMLSPKRTLKNFLWEKRTKAEQAPFRKEQQLERSIIDKCDYMIMNNKFQKEYMLGQYDKEVSQKAIVLPHSFDESLYPEHSGERPLNDKIRMVYIGHLDDIRTPHLMFKAIRALKGEYSDLPEHLEVLFYGNMSAKEKVYLIDNELLDVVKIKRPVDYKTSLEIMKNSDWLIHIDANLCGVLNENIFFAAKLADYIGAGRPIFGITMFDGAGADIVREMNGITVSYTVDEIKNYLYLIVYKGYCADVDISNREKYNAVNVAANFDKFVEERIIY